MRRDPDSLAPAQWMIVLLALIPGCAGWGPGIAGAPCPVAWVPTQSIDSATGSLRARMQLRIRDEEIHLELIARNRPDGLVVVGLARFGVRLFAVHQEGTELRVEGASSRELSQVALWVMDALHRAYWIVPPDSSDSSDSSEASEATTWAWGGERVSESRLPGALHREFSIPNSSSWGTQGADPATRRLTIDYHDRSEDTPENAWEADPDVASSSGAGTIFIHNPWCGYDATIVPIRE